MGKTLIEIDDELLAQAAELLGTTTTKKDTVNRALSEYATSIARSASSYGAWNGLGSRMGFGIGRSMCRVPSPTWTAQSSSDRRPDYCCRRRVARHHNPALRS
jgi:hypothetical protein